MRLKWANFEHVVVAVDDKTTLPGKYDHSSPPAANGVQSPGDRFRRGQEKVGFALVLGRRDPENPDMDFEQAKKKQDPHLWLADLDLLL